MRQILSFCPQAMGSFPLQNEANMLLRIMRMGFLVTCLQITRKMYAFSHNIFSDEFPSFCGNH